MVAKNGNGFWSGYTKAIGLGAIGAVVGYFAGASAVGLFKDGGALEGISGAEPALLVALMYLVMGLIVGTGSLSPRLGAAILNVEDADEVREERGSLQNSAIGCLLCAISLIAFAIGGPGAVLAPVYAATIGIGAIVLALLPTLKVMRNSDELMRSLTRECAASAYYLVFSVAGCWAALAHLGLASAPSMIDLLALFWAAPLLTAFWVTGKKGMLKPRN